MYQNVPIEADFATEYTKVVSKYTYRGRFDVRYRLFYGFKHMIFRKEDGEDVEIAEKKLINFANTQRGITTDLKSKYMKSNEGKGFHSTQMLSLLMDDRFNFEWKTALAVLPTVWTSILVFKATTHKNRYRLLF